MANGSGFQFWDTLCSTLLPFYFFLFVFNTAVAVSGIISLFVTEPGTASYVVAQLVIAQSVLLFVLLGALFYKCKQVSEA